MTTGVKLVVRGTLQSGDEWRNLFYYTGPGDFTDTTVQNWVQGLYTTISVNMPNGWTIYGVDVAVRLGGFVDTDPLGWGASTFVAKAMAGGAGTTSLPPGDCMLVIAQTGVKHVMGKKFLAGIMESVQDGGVLSAGMLSALTAFGVYWMTPTADPLGSGSTSAVWGPRHGFTPIKSTKADTHVYHLRSRQQGHGI